MDDMRKRPGGDVTPDDASSSSSAKRRRDQAAEESADISVTPAANEVVQHNGDVPPVANAVAAEIGAVVAVPPVANDVVDLDIIAVDVWDPLPANGVFANRGGDILIPPPVNGVAAAERGHAAVPPVHNDVIDVDVWDFHVVMASNDETLSELTRLLDLNNLNTAAGTTPFAETPFRSPPMVFQTMSTSYVTINRNEESCGSSFSDAESSVMASVDWNGRDERQAWMGYTAERGSSSESAWIDAAEIWAREVLEAPDLDVDWDDVALARFLGEDDINPQRPFSGTP